MSGDDNDFEIERLVIELGAAKASDVSLKNGILDRLASLNLLRVFESDSGVLLKHHLRNSLSNPLTIQSAVSACTSLLPALDAKFLSNVVENLGDAQPQTRKFSHMLLLAHVKHHKSMKLVSKVMMEIGFASSNNAIKHKSVNSFQGLVLSESICIDWQSQEILAVVVTLLSIWSKDANPQVRNAAEDTLVSLCKCEGMKQIVSKLGPAQLSHIQIIAEKHLILGLLPSNLENSNALLKKYKNEESNPRLPENQQLMQQSQQHSKTTIPAVTSPIPLSTKVEAVKGAEGRKKFGLLTEKQFEDLTSLKDWQLKAKAIEDLEKQLFGSGEGSSQQISLVRLMKEDDLQEFMMLLLDLSLDFNERVQISSLRIVLPLASLPKCGQHTMYLLISSAMVEKLADTKSSVRLLASQIILKHFSTFEGGEWVGALLQRVKSGDVGHREEILSLLEKILTRWLQKNRSKLQISQPQQRRNVIKMSYQPSDWKSIIKELSVLLREKNEAIVKNCIACLLCIHAVLPNPEEFLDCIQSTLSKDEEYLVLREISGIDDPTSLSVQQDEQPKLSQFVAEKKQPTPSLLEEPQSRVNRIPPKSQPESLRSSVEVNMKSKMIPSKNFNEDILSSYKESKPTGNPAKVVSNFISPIQVNAQIVNTPNNNNNNNNYSNASNALGSSLVTRSVSQFTTLTSESSTRKIGVDSRVSTGKQSLSNLNYSISQQNFPLSNSRVSTNNTNNPSTISTADTHSIFQKGNNMLPNAISSLTSTSSVRGIGSGSSSNPNGNFSQPMARTSIDKKYSTATTTTTTTKQVAISLMNSRETQSVGKNDQTFDFKGTNSIAKAAGVGKMGLVNGSAASPGGETQNYMKDFNMQSQLSSLKGQLHTRSSQSLQTKQITSKSISAQPIQKQYQQQQQQQHMNPTDFFEDQAYQSYQYKPPLTPTTQKINSKTQLKASESHNLIDSEEEEERQRDNALATLKKKRQLANASAMGETAQSAQEYQSTTSVRKSAGEFFGGVGGNRGNSSTLKIANGSRVRTVEHEDKKLNFGGAYNSKHGDDNEEDDRDLDGENSQHNASKYAARSGINVESNNYTHEKDLEAVKNPESSVNSAMKELKSGDWDRQFKGLDLIRRLNKFHSDTLAKSPQFQSILKEVNGLIDNLRSSLAKNAMMTISEMGWKMKRLIEVELEGSFSKLVKKGMDANAFILDEVKSALASLSSNCTPVKIINLCLSLNTKSAQSKQYVTQCFSTLISVHSDKIASMREFDRIIECLAKYCVDSAVEVRNAAKAALGGILGNSVLDSMSLKMQLMKTQDEATVNKILNGVSGAATAAAGGESYLQSRGMMRTQPLGMKNTSMTDFDEFMGSPPGSGSGAASSSHGLNWKVEKAGSKVGKYS